MFKEGSEYPSGDHEGRSGESMSEIAPGVFDASALVEQEIAKEDPVFAETLAEIEKATDPHLRHLLEKIKDRMVTNYMDARYTVDERPTQH